MTRLMEVPVLAAAVALSLFAQTAPGCPAFLRGEQLISTKSSARQDLRGFSWDNGGWRSVPVQVDPVQGDGRLSFFSDDTWLKSKIERSDRISLRVESFGNERPINQPFPCSANHAVQVRETQSSRVTYLLFCNDLSNLPGPPPPVVYRQGDQTLESDQYRYVFQKRNHMLFDAIYLKDVNGAEQLIASKSDLAIRSDIKSFFTMVFDGDDIESQLEDFRSGPLGIVGRVSFYLRILFFKIRLSLTTDVSFFADGAYIPMTMHLPKDARKNLNAGSGVIYSWETPKNGTSFVDTSKVFVTNPELIPKGADALGKAGLASCGGFGCRSQVAFLFGGSSLQMMFDIPKKFVGWGFFPQYVNDMRSFHKQLKWPYDKKGERAGLYMEVSGLPSGTHSYGFWMLLSNADRAATTCPAPIQVRKVNKK